jgi:transcriptional regulator with XRE-family HTH domain
MDVGARQKMETQVLMAPADDTHHAQLLGERLRLIRQQQGLSLHDVETMSDGELKASVVGAYERGERTISIRRLERLADFYRLPVAELLRSGKSRPMPAGEVQPEDRVVIDLVALEEHVESEPILARYVASIRSRRGDFNGRVLTVRGSDLSTIAAVMETAPESLIDRLAETGLLR